VSRVSIAAIDMKTSLSKTDEREVFSVQTDCIILAKKLWGISGIQYGINRMNDAVGGFDVGDGDYRLANFIFDLTVFFDYNWSRI
jgi:hypothetical protein